MDIIRGQGKIKPVTGQGQINPKPKG